MAATVKLCSEPAGFMKQGKAGIEALIGAVCCRAPGDRLEIENVDCDATLVFWNKSQAGGFAG